MLLGGGAIWWAVLKRRARALGPELAVDGGESRLHARDLLDGEGE
jgi:hypothetical protein